MEARLEFDIHAQPDDTTCGPTCLQAMYHYYGDQIALEDVIAEVGSLGDEGGTLAVMLGAHALKRGYKATIFSYNLMLFDPSWFKTPGIDLQAKLTEQLRHKDAPKLRVATQAYVEFLRLGGKVRFEDLTSQLLRRYLKRAVPILTGLSATYLYQCEREIFPGGRYAVSDDIRGEPTGHFVVLCGYDQEMRQALVADPYAANPVSSDLFYHVDINHVICSIMLGVLTYDANFLLIEPKKDEERPKRE